MSYKKPLIKSAIVAICLIPIALSGCSAQMASLQTKIQTSLDNAPGSTTLLGDSAKRASRRTPGRASLVLDNICFPHFFENIRFPEAAKAVNAVKVDAPGTRPSSLPEKVWSFQDTPLLVFWPPAGGLGCNIGVFDGDIDKALIKTITTIREDFGRKGSTSPNPFARIPVLTFEQLLASPIGPIRGLYEGNTWRLRILPQSIKDITGVKIKGFVMSLQVQ